MPIGLECASVAVGGGRGGEGGGSLTLNDGVNAGQCTHYTAVLLSVSTECGLSVLIGYHMALTTQNDLE